MLGSNLELLQHHAEIPIGLRSGTDPEIWAELARSYHERGDTAAGIATMALAAGKWGRGTRAGTR